MRLFAYVSFKKISDSKIIEANSYLMIYFHGTYGLWCLHNILRFRASSAFCKQQFESSIVAYQIFMILSVYSGSLVLGCIVVLTVMIPLVSYILWKNYRERTAQSRKTKQLM